MSEFAINKIRKEITDKSWVVACLCAQWCDTCVAYSQTFHQLSIQYPEICFVWVDIEDQCDMIGDLDVENFPTINIQYQETTLFLGTVLPDIQQLVRLINNLQQSLHDSNQAKTLISQHQLPHPEWNLRNQILNNPS